MTLSKAFIPYRGYWSSPFARWQGTLSRAHALELAARTAGRFFSERGIDRSLLDGIVLGQTVPQHRSFYGAPWLAALLELQDLTGPTVSQACATSVRALMTAALEVEHGAREAVLAVCCDRCSNGPHLYYPDPGGVGGRGVAEDWVWDNFNCDPNTGKAMIQTAENVARAEGITKEEQDEVTLLRYQQYQEALADGRAFQKRYMVPAEVPKGRKETVALEADEGVFPTTAEGLAKLRPVLDGGTVTFGTQTYPADGNAGALVCSEDRARALSADPKVTIRVLAFGQARVEKAHMPKAVVPAAEAALQAAGIGVQDLAAVKTHNPFAVNDVFFGRKTGLPLEKMNRYGSPLIYGHPQGPTGLRAIAELLEELVEAGGGHGLFTGCAAGDTAMAAVFRVDC